MLVNLTLKQLSERIATPGDDVKRVARRIRHWTNEKLIPTEGDAHSGKGRHRLYDSEGLLIGSILWELSRYDVPVGVLEQIHSAIENLYEFIEVANENELEPLHWDIEDILEGRFDNWIAITIDQENGKVVCTQFDPSEEVYSDPLNENARSLKQLLELDSVIIINMHKIAARVSKP